MGLKLTNLQKAQELLSQQEDVQQTTDVIEDLTIEEYLTDMIKSNMISTIRIKYEYGEIITISTLGKLVRVVTFPNHNIESYLDFCRTMLKIDTNERENCSRSIIIGGIKTRVFAIMPPYATQPVITISTTKIPPQHLENQSVPDQLLDEIVHNNFIIVGPSGSGKTYLMNYMLNKFIGEGEQIGIIEEFMELIPPNRLCTSLVCPPPKSDERSKLRFLTEQSNLMRLDAIYVGEIKGAEAWPFVINLASGTRGGCTMHGESASRALSRLRALCQLEVSNVDAINEFIAKSINYVIVMKKWKIDSIHKLNGTHNKGNFSMDRVF